MFLTVRLVHVADVRDGDFEGRGWTQSEGTHGERGGGSGGSDQLNEHWHTGLLHFVLVWTELSSLILVVLLLYILFFFSFLKIKVGPPPVVMIKVI